MDLGEVLQLLKAGFGFCHAPRKWWEHISRVFIDCGAVLMPVDAASGPSDRHMDRSVA